MQAGDTFLIPKRTDDFEHLWVVLTDPDDDDMAVCVNITEKRLYSDTTIVLVAGDHPYVRKASVANYPDAQLLDMGRVSEALEADAKSFVCKSHRPCSGELLEKLRNGLLRSPHTPKQVKAVCSDAWECW